MVMARDCAWHEVRIMRAIPEPDAPDVGGPMRAVRTVGCLGSIFPDGRGNPLCSPDAGLPIFLVSPTTQVMS